MSKKTVKIIALIIGIAFLLGIIFPLIGHFAFSSPDSKSLDSQINEITDNINRLNSEITASTEELSDAAARLDAAEDLLKKTQSESSERFRIMCERGTLSYLNIIFSATSLPDFTDRIVIARELYEYDMKVLNAINKIKKEIENDKSEIENLLKAQNTMAEELEKNKEELENNKNKLKSQAF